MIIFCVCACAYVTLSCLVWCPSHFAGTGTAEQNKFLHISPHSLIPLRPKVLTWRAHHDMTAAQEISQLPSASHWLNRFSVLSITTYWPRNILLHLQFEILALVSSLTSYQSIAYWIAFVSCCACCLMSAYNLIVSIILRRSYKQRPKASHA